jgi:hypothetical protein
LDMDMFQGRCKKSILVELIKKVQGESTTNDHEESFITPENERYCAGGSGTRSIKFLEI